MATAHRRVLGFSTLLFVNVAAIFSLRTVTDVARFGWGALTMTAGAFAVFFVPLTLAVIALSAQHPEEGGLYRWTQRAFGPAHGFVCGWTYFVNNLVYFPAVLTYVASTLPWLVHGRGAAYADAPGYVVAVGLIGLWGVGVIPNILGARRMALVSSAGVAASLLGTAILAGLAALALARGNPIATPLSTWIPRFDTGAGTIAMLALVSSFPFMFAGLELAPTLGDEVVDARRTLVRAALAGGAVVTALFFAAIAAVVIGLGAEGVGLTDGIPSSVAALAAQLGLGTTPVRAIAACLVVGAAGAVAVWMAGSARLVRAAGVDRVLPAWFTRDHPRLGTPVGGLLAQGVVASLLLLASVAGSTVREAYAVLRAVTQIIYFIPFLYLFASHARLAPPAARGRARLTSAIGFATTLVGLVAASLPPADVSSVARFELKVVGGSIALILAGVPLFIAGRRRQA